MCCQYIERMTGTIARERILNAIYDNYEIIKSAERKLISVEFIERKW